MPVINISKSSNLPNKKSPALFFSSLFIWVSLSIIINPAVHAISVDLGSLPLTSSSVSASSVREQARFAPSTTTDRNIVNLWSISLGWSVALADINSPQTIDWTWANSPSPALSAGQSVEYYTYTINLHYSWNAESSLRQFTLASKSPDASQYNTIRDYESLSTANAYTITNNRGTITTGQPESNDPLDTHTLVFKSNSIINSLRLTTAANPGWGNNNEFFLAEITGSATAEVVPEPSTYTFFSGLLAAVFTLIRRKKVCI